MHTLRPMHTLRRSLDKDHDLNSNEAIVAIANPSAGRGCRQGAEPAWIKRLPANAKMRFSEHPNHAEELALEASLLGCSMIVAIGGDGTVHEVLNGLLRNSRNGSCLGIIATGTANDYAKSLWAYRSKHASNSDRVDVGRVHWGEHHRYFANVAGVGLPGKVAHFARPMRRLFPRLRYTLALLRCLGGAFRTEEIEVSLDVSDPPVSALEKQVLMLSIAIGTREGSFELAPNAKFDDGLFDVLQVGGLSRLDLLRYFPGVLRGRIPTTDPRIFTSRCSRLSLRSSRPFPVHLDGESPSPIPTTGLTECQFEVLPKRISVQLL